MSLLIRLVSLRAVYLGLISLILVLAACSPAPSGTGNQGGNDGNGAATDGGGDGGDGGGDGGGGGEDDVCRLVTQDEVEDAVSEIVDDWDVAEGEETDGACNFAVTGDEDQGELGSVDIRLTENFPRESYEIVVESFEGEEVSGLGEDAYWGEDVMNLGVFLSGDRYLEVQIVIFAAESGQREAAIELAELALGRL